MSRISVTWLPPRYQQYGPLFSGSHPESSKARPVQAAINLGSFNALQPARQPSPSSPPSFLLSLLGVPPSRLQIGPHPSATLTSVFAYAHNSERSGLPFTINFIKSPGPLPVASLLPYLNNGFSKSRFRGDQMKGGHVTYPRTCIRPAHTSDSFCAISAKRRYLHI